MWAHGYGMTEGLGFFGMWVLWFLILAGIGVLVFAVIRLASGSRSGRPDGVPAPAAGGGGPAAPVSAASSARAILEERYARGEIDTADFTERIRTIEGGQGDS